VISGFCHEVDENCTLLGYSRVKIQFGFLTLENGTIRLSQNVTKMVPVLSQMVIMMV
jgi:hypothetical protein